MERFSSKALLVDIEGILNYIQLNMDEEIRYRLEQVPESDKVKLKGERDYSDIDQFNAVLRAHRTGIRWSVLGAIVCLAVGGAASFDGFSRLMEVNNSGGLNNLLINLKGSPSSAIETLAGIGSLIFSGNISLRALDRKRELDKMLSDIS